MAISDRYSRQILFHGIGSESQQKIVNSNTTAQVRSTGQMFLLPV